MVPVDYIIALLDADEPPTPPAASMSSRAAFQDFDATNANEPGASAALTTFGPTSL